MTTTEDTHPIPGAALRALAREVYEAHSADHVAPTEAVVVELANRIDDSPSLRWPVLLHASHNLLAEARREDMARAFQTTHPRSSRSSTLAANPDTDPDDDFGGATDADIAAVTHVAADAYYVEKLRLGNGVRLMEAARPEIRCQMEHYRRNIRGNQLRLHFFQKLDDAYEDDDQVLQEILSPAEVQRMLESVFNGSEESLEDAGFDGELAAEGGEHEEAAE